MLNSKRGGLTFKRCATLLCVIAANGDRRFRPGAGHEGVPEDWEEINFEFNSSVLVDGFPSLLRLAELLQKNPGYKVQVEGHTDMIGGTSYNDKLGSGSREHGSRLPGEVRRAAQPDQAARAAKWIPSIPARSRCTQDR